MDMERTTLEELALKLVDEGLLSKQQAQELVVGADNQRARLALKMGANGQKSRDIAQKITDGQLVAAFKFVKPGTTDTPLEEDEVVRVMAQLHGMEYLKIDPLKLDASLVTRTISLPFARRTSVLPIKKQANTLRVAVANPNDSMLFEELAATTQLLIEPVLAARTDIQQYLTEVHGFNRSVTNAAKEYGTQIDIGNLEQMFQLGKVDEIETNEQHVVNAVDYLLHYAFGQRASDIHVEPKRSHSQIRMRIDGVLHDIYKMPKQIHAAVVSRFKTMARMDLAEKRKPQDGRFKTQKDDGEVEMRVSSLPVAFGEKLVIRVFDPTILIQDIAELGFTPESHRRFMKFVERPNGLVLVTGPTGSGKTTTLYSTLKHLSSSEVNVVSIEDPIEMVMEDFNQIAVQNKIGVNFATALRHVLRQDPDIIMVGEIRDKETADQALQAALTGHLVLSTLHTNDTATSVTRMLELGANPYLLASTLVGVIAQRLVRCVCAHCKEETSLNADQMLALGIEPANTDSDALKVWQGKGCVKCRNTGLYGRTGVFELLSVNDTIKELIGEKADAPQILRAGKADGTITLRESAIQKLADGMTSFSEVIRTTVDTDKQ